MSAPVKILVSVGTQFPFDRLVASIDAWAGQHPQLAKQVLMQVGPGGHMPENAQGVEFLDPADYKQAAESADVLVAHAGIGSILTATELGLPVIIFPRSFELGEHRNDHQSSTAREFSHRRGVYVATNDDELYALLAQRETLEKPANAHLDEDLANRIDRFIQGGF